MNKTKVISLTKKLVQKDYPNLEVAMQDKHAIYFKDVNENAEVKVVLDTLDVEVREVGKEDWHYVDTLEIPEQYSIIKGLTKE